MNNNRIKKIVIIILVLTIFIMSTAYAVLFNQLNIGGNASVTAYWKVEITDIREGTIVGTAYSIDVPTHTTSTASFNASLSNSADSIEYIVTIKNSGSIDARFNDYSFIKTGDAAIIYDIEGANKDEVLKAGQSKEIIIRVRFDSNNEIVDGLSSDAKIIFNYIQNV